MKCINPISIQVRSSPHAPVYSVAVGCGKCIACKQQYQNSWMIRLIEESKCHSSFIFFTLTYREKASFFGERTVPFFADPDTGEIYRTVYKKHVQDWIKRFRTYLSRNGKNSYFKYFITSEYGPTTLRPHYHGCLFGVDKYDFLQAVHDWQETFGYVNFKYIPITDRQSSKIMRYIAKYCSKGMFENPLVDEGKVNPTFHLISKGIGKQYVENNFNYHHARTGVPRHQRLENIIERLNYKHNGFCYKLPRYYKEKIFKPGTCLALKVQSLLLEKYDDLYRQKLAQLQAERCISLDEATRIMVMQEANDIAYQHEAAIKKISEFYSKSKI